ncbi:cytochrome c oxidase accessory protein CcoG [Roseivirga sp. BDSF3-8]|uniref:cytochrome c oxidase accessory protein CcoG n=1 Tax=Roseivirga sp. BDSF3-8 TaxID=3241598 RepID=UPI0035318DB8
MLTAEEKQSYRDKISTVDAEGKRVWIYPKKPSGPYYNWRKWVSYGLLILLFAGPFLRIDGQPVLLLNILERKFIILGQVFWPQDFHLFALALIAGVVFIILFTVVYGRLFCGWVCPQTIFMEMLFRRIEYAIEGDWTAQRKLDKEPWHRTKVLKKGSKHLIFFVISFIIANTFLAYIIGSEELISIITDPPAEHVGGLLAILIFTGVFYGVFAKFREQVCTTVCPYGRLQGVLLDRKSVVVSYDYNRGEPRGKFRKKEDREEVGKGDCIECMQCVQVCPTGIDIRNGTQLECINCTACIDACNTIMDQVNLPRDLIRYDSEEAIADPTKKSGFRMDTRSVAYSLVLVALLGVIGALLFMRSQVETSVLRTPGTMYQEQPDGRISNLYQYKVVNKSNEELEVMLTTPDHPDAEISFVGQESIIQVPPQGTAEGAMFIILPQSAIREISQEINLQVESPAGEEFEAVSTTFLGPVK